MQDQYHDVFKKVVVIGDSGVGKTNITNNFTKNSNQLQQLQPTLGVVYSAKILPLKNGKTVKVQIWDTAGQQRYRSVTSDQIKKALGAVVMFDITNRRTFQSVNFWITQVRDQGPQNIQIIMVGNKADNARVRSVSFDNAAQLANKHGIEYRQTSSMDSRSINQLFTSISQKIMAVRDNDHVAFGAQNHTLKLQGPSLADKPNEQPRTGCCK